MGNVWDVVHLPVLEAAAKRLEAAQLMVRSADLKADLPEISLGSLKEAITQLGTKKGKALLQTAYEAAGEYIAGITPAGRAVLNQHDDA